MELIEALLALEHAAADVESFLPVDATPAELVELLDAWGPPRRKPNTSRTRELQLVDWVAWLRDCGARWEARPNCHTTPEIGAIGHGVTAFGQTGPAENTQISQFATR